MICYTAVYAGKNPVVAAPGIREPGMEYVCFTDSDKLIAPGWDIRVTRRPDQPTSRLQAKWFKLHPHELFPGEKTMWMDGNCRIKSKLTPIFDSVTSDTPFAMYTHPGRIGFLPCAYKEIDVCIERTADHYKNLLKLRDFLTDENYPKNAGLYVGRTMWRDPAASVVNKLWWDIVCKTTSRDQPSLAYVLWKLNIEVFNLGEWDHARVVVTKNSKHSFHGTRDNKGKRMKFEAHPDVVAAKVALRSAYGRGGKKAQP
jgi:hypothetical protein